MPLSRGVLFDHVARSQDCSELDCPFAKTYAEMIALARTMGRRQPQPPDVFLAPPRAACLPFPL